MVVGYTLAVIGVILAFFGVIGVLSAEAIVERQREKGLSRAADETIDERTRVRVTRAMATLFTVVGAALVAVGLGVV